MKELYNLYAEQYHIDDCIKLEKKKLHTEFMQDHKGMIRMLDIMMILIIVMNFGALFLTNMMVAKVAGDGLEFKEANPVTSELHGYEPAPWEDAIPVMKLLFSRAIIWTVMFGSYWFFRKRIIDRDGAFMMVCMMGFYFILLGLDFFNNLGFFIGGLS